MHREIAAAVEAARRSSEVAARDAAALERATRRVRDADNKAAALTDEIKALKSELADSRQVGQAALQALAAANTGLIHREPRLGWRQSIRRLFGVARQR